jgi:hypothetical protein
MAIIQNDTTPKNVSFGEVRVREHERILVDQPENNVYACLAIGWAHRLSIVNSLENDQQQQQQAQQQAQQEQETTANSYKIHHDDDDASCSSLPSGTSSTNPSRYTTSERVQVLNEYGFNLKEVIGNEMQKKQKKACCVQQRRRSRKSSSSHCYDRRGRGDGSVKGLLLAWWCGGLTKKTSY